MELLRFIIADAHNGSSQRANSGLAGTHAGNHVEIMWTDDFDDEERRTNRSSSLPIGWLVQTPTRSLTHLWRKCKRQYSIGVYINNRYQHRDPLA
jgi:hypothetical protein